MRRSTLGSVPDRRKDPVALCRRAYELYGRAEFEGLLELFAEDVEVYVAPPNIESGTYHGRAAYRGLIERWGASWSQMRIVPREMTRDALPPDRAHRP